MWTVLKFDKKKIRLFTQQLQQRFGKEFEIYSPKISYQKFRNNKLVKKEFDLLGDYIFCFSKNFSKCSFINELQYFKGVKYFLSGYVKSQNEINEFVAKCKKNEDADGYLSQSFFDLKKDAFYRFSSGPFTQKIFKIIDIQKNKIKILMGNISTSIKKDNYILGPL